jgi:hypothetical protein
MASTDRIEIPLRDASLLSALSRMTIGSNVPPGNPPVPVDTIPGKAQELLNSLESKAAKDIGLAFLGIQPKYGTPPESVRRAAEAFRRSALKTRERSGEQFRLLEARYEMLRKMKANGSA